MKLSDDWAIIDLLVIPKTEISRRCDRAKEVKKRLPGTECIYNPDPPFNIGLVYRKEIIIQKRFTKEKKDQTTCRS